MDPDVIRMWSDDLQNDRCCVSIELAPNRNFQLFAPVRQGHCVVEVMKGAGNARVSLQMIDSAGNRLAAVNGQ